MIFASIIALVFVVLSIVLPFATGGSRYAARVERMLPKTVGLALPVALLPSVRARNRALVWRLSLGLGAGAIVGLLISFFIPSAENGIDFAKAWFVMGGVAIGAVVGTCVWVAQEATRRATQDAPLQRPTGVGLFDYLPMWSTVLVVVVLVLALGVGALLVWIASLGVIAPGGEPKFVPIVIAIYGVVVSLIGGLAFFTTQLHRPQRAAVDFGVALLVADEAVGFDAGLGDGQLRHAAFGADANLNHARSHGHHCIRKRNAKTPRPH